MDKAYVNEKIKLMCLRADYYDSEKGTARMMSFFSFKQQLFGDDKLARDILLDDLTGDDVEALTKGGFQLLPQRDRAGLGITLNVGSVSTNYSIGIVVVHEGEARERYRTHFVI